MKPHPDVVFCLYEDESQSQKKAQQIADIFDKKITCRLKPDEITTENILNAVHEAAAPGSCAINIVEFDKQRFNSRTQIDDFASFFSKENLENCMNNETSSPVDISNVLFIFTGSNNSNFLELIRICESKQVKTAIFPASAPQTSSTELKKHDPTRPGSVYFSKTQIDVKNVKLISFQCPLKYASAIYNHIKSMTTDLSSQELVEHFKKLLLTEPFQKNKDNPAQLSWHFSLSRTIVHFARPTTFVQFQLKPHCFVIFQELFSKNNVYPRESDFKSQLKTAKNLPFIASAEELMALIEPKFWTMATSTKPPSYGLVLRSLDVIPKSTEFIVKNNEKTVFSLFQRRLLDPKQPKQINKERVSQAILGRALTSDEPMRSILVTAAQMLTYNSLETISKEIDITCRKMIHELTKVERHLVVFLYAASIDYNNRELNTINVDGLSLIFAII